MMKASPRPLPTWLKWLMRLFGVVLIAYAALSLFLTSLYFWLLAHTKDGLLAKSGDLLAGGLGRLVVTLLILWLGVWLLRRSSRKVAEPGEEIPESVQEPKPVAEVVPVRTSSNPGKRKRWYTCNVLEAGVQARRLWQFDARNEQFKLNREQTARNGEQLPPNLVGKSWGAIFQSKLNVAWLPPENVFLRAAQFPVSSPEETRAMVELQLEKLSPIPVTQALWTMHVLPQTAPRLESENLQTIIVIVVARDAVEEFLGKLEGQGYMADRLELPMLDQLQATRITGDGAWVFPESYGANSRALIAWWYGGVLQNLGFLTLETGPNRMASLKDQLVQMTWAGELEGWLTSAPRLHLAAAATDEWQPALREALDQPVEVVAPVPAQELAALTAKRAAQADVGNTLMPPEFPARYKQQLQDRLWGRALLAVLVVYAIGLGIYFVALTVYNGVTDKVEAQANGMADSYTNSIQLTGMLGVLKERDELKFAALDCWNAVAETLPEGLTLDTLNFSDGHSLSLRGTAPPDQVTTVTDFYDKVRKWKSAGQPLFDTSNGDVPRIVVNPGGGTVTWSFDLELTRTEK